MVKWVKPCIHAVNAGYLHYLKQVKIQAGNFGLKIITYICPAKNFINSLVINKKFKRLSKINNH